MRRVDRMDLEDEVGDAIERSVGAQGSDHVVGRSDVHVERHDKRWDRGFRGDKTDSDQMINDLAEADIGQAQRFPSSATNRVRDAICGAPTHAAALQDRRR